MNYLVCAIKSQYLEDLAVASNCFTLKVERPSPSPANIRAEGSTKRSVDCLPFTDAACNQKKYQLKLLANI